MDPILTPPLRSNRVTQPFGVDWTGVELYRRLGMKGHNGIDLRAPTGTEVLASIGGEAYVEVEAPIDKPPPGYISGYGINVKIRNRAHGIEVIYAHLQNTLVKNYEVVKQGQVIATTDNTGTSSAPHLHFGVRRVEWKADGSGPYPVDYGNGYFGSIDPRPLLPPDFDALPVDRRYGLTPRSPGVPSEIAFLPSMAYFFRTTGRLMTTRQYNALRFGFWDLRTVMDDAMFQTWSDMTKPEAAKRGIIKRI